MRPRTICQDCKQKFSVLHLWKNNFLFASGTKWLCEKCFQKRTFDNAHHLLSRYHRMMANRDDQQIYDLFAKTYDRSSQDEKILFLEFLGDRQNGNVV